MTIAVLFLLTPFFFLLRATEFFTNIKILKKGLILFEIASIAFLCSLIVPLDTWDLFHHYEEIDLIRANGFEYAIHGSKYHAYPTIVFLFYLCSLTPWNQTIVFITIFIELLICYKITSYFISSNKLTPRASIVVFLLYLSSMNITHAISGIRNVLAVSLVCFSIWGFFTSKKRVVNYLFFIILILLAIGLHPACALILLILFISLIPSKVLQTVLGLFFLPLCSFLVSLVPQSLSGNLLIAAALNLFDTYSSSSLGADIRVLMVTLVFCVIGIFFILKYCNSKNRFSNYVFAYFLALIGCSLSGIYFTRLMYGLPIAATWVFCQAYRTKSKNTDCFILTCYSAFYSIGMLAFYLYEIMRAVLLK